MNFKKFIPLIALFITIQTSAQINESQYHQIDSLFIEWNKPNHPGGVIGVMKNGKTVFSKAYGLASLEYLAPNTTSTLFNTASVSKQFTAMGIVVLQQQGKLSVDDDIRKYLPELPDFGETITISHLLHHTSGLRSLHAMLGLAGWRGDDARTNEDLNRFVLNQRDLNFKPGDEYLYCNTGYMLMLNIIEKITGEKFSDWMKKSVFDPLGMINTYVEENYSRIVPNNATSYYNKQNNQFERAVEYWGYIGSGNMHSNTSDLLQWLTNFYDPQPNWEAHFKILQTLDKFNNGEDNNYAYGVVVGEYNGYKRVQHGGSIGGFRSYIGVYPEEELKIVVLTNFSSSSTGSKANQISDILLKKVNSNNTEKEVVSKLKTIKLSNDQLKKYEASYWNDKNNYVRKIYLKDDTLRYFRTENNKSLLAPIGKNEFQMLGDGEDVKVKFEFEKNGEKTMTLTIDDKSPIQLKSFDPTTSKGDLASYTGEFYSPELETTYVISVVDEKLFCHHSRHGDFPMKVLKKDVLEGQWPFNIAKFSRDENGVVTGIFVSNGRVRNLWFEKKK